MGNYDSTDLDYQVSRDGSVERIKPFTGPEGFLPHWVEFFSRSKDQHHTFSEAKDHFVLLMKAALELDHRLKKCGSPYRFCVYQKSGEILVEMIRLDENGKVIEDSTQNITHDEFYRWITDFDSGEGLLFDKTG